MAPLEPFERNPVHSTYPFEQDDYRLHFRNIAPSILTSLYHPIVWRALLNLSTDVQKAALQGDRAALEALARHVIKWFEDKLRRKQLLNLGEERLLQLLATIAGRTSFGSWCFNSDWLIPTSDVCGPHIAYDFLKEAELTALIEFGSDKKWCWKHAFVYHFLAGHQG